MEENTTVQTVTDPSVVDMALGHPDPELLPLEMMRRAAEHRFGVGDPLILQYGGEKGDEGFRGSVSAFLSRFTGERADLQQLMISGGVSQSLDLICTLYTKPGTLVVVEDPTYFLALRIFEDHGLRVASVPTGPEGMDVDALDSLLERETPALVYTIPSFQNPRGFCMSDERRRRLVELAGREGFMVVADEVYRPLRYSGNQTTPFSEIEGSERVFSLGSFSKILGPGLRLGWIRGASRSLHRLVTCGRLDSGGGINAFTASIVKSALASGDMDAHLQRLREVYSARISSLTAALEEEFIEFGDFSVPEGGYFVWITLRRGLTAESLADAAKEEGVRFLPGTRCSPNGEAVGGKPPGAGFFDSIRLSISFNSEDRLREGVARLARAAKRCLRSSS